MVSKSGKDLGEHVLSGDSKNGFELKCDQCGKIWFSKGVNKTCNKECFRESRRKYMNVNNPMNDPITRNRCITAAHTQECNEKRREWTFKNNPMKRPDIKEKHRLKMGTMIGENNPIYTNPNGLDNLRKSQRTPEIRAKKILFNANPEYKENKRNYMKINNPMFNEKIKLKNSISRTRPYETIQKYIEYCEAVWQETNRVLITNKKYIKNYELRGKKHGYELDHRYSIHEGFEYGIDPKIIGHCKNLEIITQFENGSKHKKCSITLEELLNLIDESEMFENA